MIHSNSRRVRYEWRTARGRTLRAQWHHAAVSRRASPSSHRVARADSRLGRGRASRRAQAAPDDGRCLSDSILWLERCAGRLRRGEHAVVGTCGVRARGEDAWTSRRAEPGGFESSDFILFDSSKFAVVYPRRAAPTRRFPPTCGTTCNSCLNWQEHAGRSRRSHHMRFART